jgi:hypothetical protein
MQVEQFVPLFLAQAENAVTCMIWKANRCRYTCRLLEGPERDIVLVVWKKMTVLYPHFLTGPSAAKLLLTGPIGAKLLT